MNWLGSGRLGARYLGPMGLGAILEVFCYLQRLMWIAIGSLRIRAWLGVLRERVCASRCLRNCFGKERQSDLSFPCLTLALELKLAAINERLSFECFNFVQSLFISLVSFEIGLLEGVFAMMDKERRSVVQFLTSLKL